MEYEQAKNNGAAEKIQKTSMEKEGMTDIPRGRSAAFLRFIAQKYQSAPDIEARYQEWESIYRLPKCELSRTF